VIVRLDKQRLRPHSSLCFAEGACSTERTQINTTRKKQNTHKLSKQGQNFSLYKTSCLIFTCREIIWSVPVLYLQLLHSQIINTWICWFVRLKVIFMAAVIRYLSLTILTLHLERKQHWDPSDRNFLLLWGFICFRNIRDMDNTWKHILHTLPNTNVAKQEMLLLLLSPRKVTVPLSFSQSSDVLKVRISAHYRWQKSTQTKHGVHFYYIIFSWKITGFVKNWT